MTLAGDAGLREREKIEALLKAVEGMTEAKFIRDGAAYDGKAAADRTCG